MWYIEANIEKIKFSVYFNISALQKRKRKKKGNMFESLLKKKKICISDTSSIVLTKLILE